MCSGPRQSATKASTEARSAQAGIEAFPGARRVPGLRKEELAVLARVSSDYYSRFEQGRQANISRSVLDALARALRLDETQHAHLLDLADPDRADPTVPTRPPEAAAVPARSNGRTPGCCAS